MALKRSRQREMIKSFLMGRKDHPTADVIYSNLKQQDPNLSLGTVYRNLTSGVVKSLCCRTWERFYDSGSVTVLTILMPILPNIIISCVRNAEALLIWTWIVLIPSWRPPERDLTAGSGDISLISMALVPPAPGLLRSPSFLNENGLRSIIYLC